MDKYFASLLLVLSFAAGSQALLCYWCSGVGEDRECEQHPYSVRTGPIYINCRSRYCITAKVTDALTGEVQSFARLCDNISRGNQCVRDSRLVTCYESCTSDLCNNGNPGPDYLDTFNYARYDSAVDKNVKRKNFVPVEMGEDFQHDEKKSIAVYKGLTDEEANFERDQFEGDDDIGDNFQGPDSALFEEDEDLLDDDVDEEENERDSRRMKIKERPILGDELGSAAAARSRAAGGSDPAEDKPSQNYSSPQRPAPSVPRNQKPTSREGHSPEKAHYTRTKLPDTFHAVPSSPFSPPPTRMTKENPRTDEKAKRPSRVRPNDSENLVNKDDMLYGSPKTPKNKKFVQKGGLWDRQKQRRGTKQEGMLKTKQQKKASYPRPTQETPRTVIDQHPTVYISPASSSSGSEEGKTTQKATPLSVTSTSVSTQDPEANVDPSPSSFTPSESALKMLVSSSSELRLSEQDKRQNGLGQHGRVAPHVTQPSAFSVSQKYPDVVMSYPSSSSTSRGSYEELMPVIASPRIMQSSQPADTFMANLHTSTYLASTHKLVPVNPSTARNPEGSQAYLYPMRSQTTEFQDPRPIQYQNPMAASTPTINFGSQLPPHPVLSAHQERAHVNFDSSFSSLKDKPTVQKPNLYSAFQPQADMPAFVSKPDAERLENDLQKSNLIQPAFEDGADSRGGGMDVTEAIDENEAAFVEAGYRLDSIDNLVSAFRQHPGNRYLDPEQNPGENSEDEGRPPSPGSAPLPALMTGQGHEGDRNKTETYTHRKLPGSAILQDILEETKRKTGGIFIPASRTKFTPKPSSVENTLEIVPSESSVTVLDRSILITDAPTKLILGTEHNFSRKTTSRRNTRPSESQLESQLAKKMDKGDESRETSADDTTSPRFTSTTVSGSQAAPTFSTLSTAVTFSTTAKNVVSGDVTTSKVDMTSDPTISSGMASNDVTAAQMTKPSEVKTTETTKPFSRTTDVTTTSRVTPSDDVKTLAVPQTVTFPWTSDAENIGNNTERPSLTVIVSFVNSSLTGNRTHKQNGSPRTPSTTHQHASSDETGISFGTEAPQVGSVMFSPPSTVTDSYEKTSGIPDTTVDVFLRRSKAKGRFQTHGKRNQTKRFHRKDSESGRGKFGLLKLRKGRGRSESAASEAKMNTSHTDSSRTTAKMAATSPETPTSSPSFAASGTSFSTQPVRNSKNNLTTVHSSVGQNSVLPEMNTQSTTQFSSTSNDSGGPATTAAGSSKLKVTPHVLVPKPSGPTLASLNSKGHLIDTWGHVHSEDVESSKGRQLSVEWHVILLGVLSAIFVHGLRNIYQS